MFHGSLVALITPMQADGSLDIDAFLRLIEWHISEGTDGIVIAGTTGESATLDWQEQQTLIQHAVKQAAGRVPVIAGSGTQSTRTSIELSKRAMQAGADACLLVTPYYNRPPQEGLYQHYAAIAKAVPLPLILYNVPGRTGVDLLPATVARLAAIANIIGIKEATGDTARIQALLQQCDGNLDVYSGDDATSMECILMGGKGVISVTANIAPKAMHAMCAAALSKNRAQAEVLNQALIPLHQQLFVESNPIPTKWLLQQQGRIPAGIRLPLTPLAEAYHEQVWQAWQHASHTY